MSAAAKLEDVDTTVQHVVTMGDEKRITKPKFYHTPMFSVIIVGLVALLAPGLFNALSLTGAGGSQSPFLVNKANSILYAFLTVFCIFGSFSTSLVGYKWSLTFGGLGYCIYAGGLYANKTTGNQWVIILGAVITGITGGVLWACEGAVVMGYPESKKTGMYLALWLAFKNLGTVIGSSINLGFNSKPTTSGSLSTNTYIVFIALQCLCPFVAIFLPEPHQVIRPDGTSPGKMTNRVSIVEEMGAMWKRILTRWDVLLMMPIMLYVTWFSAYSGTFLSSYFSTRSRALASFVVGVLSILANVVLGWLLDWRYLSVKQRARYGYILVMGLNIVMWIWQTIVQVQYLHHAPKKLDWVAGGSWYAGWGVYIFALIMYSINANYLYYIIKELATDPKDIVRLAGLLRGVEAAGAAFGFGMNTNSKIFPVVPLAFNFTLCVFSTAVTLPVIARVGTSYYTASVEGTEDSIAEEKEV